MRRINIVFSINLISILIFIVSEGFSQSYKSPETLEIDFEKKEIIEFPRRLQEGDFYYLKVRNINMNLYKIRFENKDSVITSDVTFPTFEIIDLENLQDIFKTISPLSETSVSVSDALKNEINTQFFLEENIDQSDIDAVVQRYVESLKDTLNRYTTYLNSETEEFQEITIALDTLSLDIQTLALSYYVERDKSWQEDLKGNLDFKEVYRKSEEFRNTIQKLINGLNGEQKKYQSFYEINKEVIGKDPDLKEKHNEITGKFASLIAGANKLFKSISAEKVNEWLTSIIHRDNNKNRSYKSLPLQLKGDLTDLDIDIEPKDEKFGLPSYHTSYRFPYPLQWQVGVSSGFYVSNLTDDAYSISATPIDSASTEISLVDEKPSNWETGTTVLFHWNLSNYCGQVNSNENLQLHLTIGPGISFSKPIKPRILAGAGIAIGRRHKLTFNILAVLGSVDRLSNKYSVSSTETVDMEEIPKSVTVTKFERSHGYSLGYIYEF